MNHLNQTNKLRAVIDYCTNNNVAIMPFSKALKHKSNSISIGEYINQDSTFVSVAGVARFGSASMGVKLSSSNTTDDVISKYDPKATTIQNITYLDDTYLGLGG